MRSTMLAMFLATMCCATASSSRAEAAPDASSGSMTTKVDPLVDAALVTPVTIRDAVRDSARVIALDDRRAKEGIGGGQVDAPGPGTAISRLSAPRCSRLQAVAAVALQFACGASTACSVSHDGPPVCTRAR